MSVAALGVVAVQLAIVGTARQPDEGSAAHLWQLLMAGQVPVIAFFAITSLPRDSRQALRILVVQSVAFLVAAAPVFIMGF